MQAEVVVVVVAHVAGLRGCFAVGAALTKREEEATYEVRKVLVLR